MGSIKSGSGYSLNGGGGGGGTGDVVGPASSTDNAYVIWDGVTGKLIKDSDIIWTSGTDYAADPYTGFTANVANAYLVVGPNGTGAIQAHVADGTAAGGNTRGDYAVDLQRRRVNAAQVASGIYSVVCGGWNNRATGSNSTVSGGINNSATTFDATAGGGRNNVASGGYSTVSGGYTNNASGTTSSVGGGQLNVPSALGACISGGRQNGASGNYSAVGGGLSNSATNLVSSTSGGYFSLADHYGEFAHGSGQFAATGDAQYSRMVLRIQTVDATPTELSADGAAPTGTDRLSLVDNSGYQFHIQVIARDTSGTDSAWWDIRGCIVRSAGAATTTLIGTNIVGTSSTAGAAAWTLTATADTVNGALKVEATGAAATIRWVATVHSTKVAY